MISPILLNGSIAVLIFCPSIVPTEILILNSSTVRVSLSSTPAVFALEPFSIVFPSFLSICWATFNPVFSWIRDLIFSPLNEGSMASVNRSKSGTSTLMFIFLGSRSRNEPGLTSYSPANFPFTSSSPSLKRRWLSAGMPDSLSSFFLSSRIVFVGSTVVWMFRPLKVLTVTGTWTTSTFKLSS